MLSLLTPHGTLMMTHLQLPEIWLPASGAARLRYSRLAGEEALTTSFLLPYYRLLLVSTTITTSFYYLLLLQYYIQLGVGRRWLALFSSCGRRGPRVGAYLLDCRRRQSLR